MIGGLFHNWSSVYDTQKLPQNTNKSTTTRCSFLNQNQAQNKLSRWMSSHQAVSNSVVNEGQAGPTASLTSAKSAATGIDIFSANLKQKFNFTGLMSGRLNKLSSDLNKLGGA